MCVLYKSCCILILQKGVPWIKEIIVLKDFPLLPVVAFCSTALCPVVRPTNITANNGHYYWHFCQQNGITTGGEV